MGVEKLGFGFPTTATFAVPPKGTFRIDVTPVSAFDGDIGALNLEKRTIPFLISKCCDSLKNDLESEILANVTNIPRRSRTVFT